MTEMEKNYQIGMRVDTSLAKNMDNLRTCVKDLYELDDDNYNRIVNHAECITNHAECITELQGELDKLKKFANKLSAKIAANRGKAILGFLGLAGLGWLAYEGIKEILDRVNARIERIEKQINIEEEEAKAEESDG